MPEIPDSFQLDSGLREDVVLTVASAYFTFDAAYQDGKSIRLILNGYDEEQEPFTIKISVGADWTTSDGGRTISHPTKKNINKNSIYGHFITAALEIPELKSVLISRDDGNGPKSALIWNDLILHCQAVEISFGRGIEARSYLMPTEYLGLAEDAPGQLPMQPVSVTSAPTATPTPPATPPTLTAAERVAAAKAAKEASAVTPPAELSPLMQKLHQLVAESSTHDDFVAKALDLDEVLADDELAVQVATPTNGIYAQLKG